MFNFISELTDVIVEMIKTHDFHAYIESLKALINSAI